jgi:iron(III) transport system ATP-binding protein
MNTIKKDVKLNNTVIVSIRPEEFFITNDESQMKGTVIDYIFLGLNTHYTVKLESEELIEIVIESSIDSIIQPGTLIHLGVKLEKINVFSEDGNQNYVIGVENDNVQEKA